MRTSIIVFLVACLAACGGGGSANPDKKLVDRMCACRDAKCIDAVDRDANALVKSLIGDAKDKRDMPEATIRRIEDFQWTLGGCRTQVRARFGIPLP